MFSHRFSCFILPQFAFSFALQILLVRSSFAQVDGAASFKLDKQTYQVGEPVFCDYVIKNAGSEAFAFPHRAPTRALNQDLGPEPRFVLTDSSGRELPDPAPQPCGGHEGTVVYGSTALPPGHTSVERWILNQWGRITAPGWYHVHAERHLPLYAFDPATQSFPAHPSGYALAVDDLSFEVVPAGDRELKKAFAPLLEILDHPGEPLFAEAVIAITAVPHPFFESRLIALTGKQSEKYPWVREEALDGLARLGTPSAWRAILEVALAKNKDSARNEPQSASANLALRASAVLLLAEKGDSEILPDLFRLLKSGPDPLQQDVLRALGFFRDPRANQVLFEHLHSNKASARMNAILGLKNLNTKDAFPALLAMLNDPDEQVRQVANFALQNLTAEKFALPPNASRAELAHTSDEWHAWWRDHNATFTPARQPPCRDW